MISGIRRNKNGRRVWRHNDLNHLEELLSADDPSTPKIIALESVYSMDGDTADLPGVIDLAHRYNALTYPTRFMLSDSTGSRGAGSPIERASSTGSM